MPGIMPLQGARAIGVRGENPPMNDSPALVTGVGGFIARQIALDLLRQGRAVRGTVRSLSRAAPLRELLARHGADVSKLEFAAADLESDAGWTEAVAGCRQVLHTASPYPLSQPKQRMALVPAARDGTLRVLRAARAAGVERVVLTSSLVAVMYGHAKQPGRVYTEADWTASDAPEVNPYQLSKTLAERAAWEDVREHGAPELVALNLGFVLGPTLDGEGGSSAKIIGLFLGGKYPGVPDFSLPMVDVRDVSAAHLAALDVPAAAGRRFIVAERTLRFIEVSRLLAEALPAYRRKLPKFEMPDWLVKMIAIVDSNVRTAVADLGKIEHADHTAASEVLGIAFRDAREAVVASAKSLIEHGRA